MSDPFFAGVIFCGVSNEIVDYAVAFAIHSPRVLATMGTTEVTVVHRRAKHLILTGRKRAQEREVGVRLAPDYLSTWSPEW